MDFKPLGAKIVPNGGRIKEGLDRSSFLAEKKSKPPRTKNPVYLRGNKNALFSCLKEQKF